MIVIGIFLVASGIALNFLSTISGDVIVIIGLIVMLIKVYVLFVREDKKKRRSVNEQASVHEHEVPHDQDPEQQLIKEPDIIYSKVFKVAGVTFKCQKNKKENRQDILSSLTEVSPIDLEEYEYKGKPVYLVVDCISDLDIGTVPEDIANEISNCFYGQDMDLEIRSIESFLPEEGIEEIYYCEVELKIYQ